jgi:starch-binding outer membrane protein, SusD/RagB family
VILYRLADIILLRAEALVMRDLPGAPTATPKVPSDRELAWALLKQIRERVFGVASATNTINDLVNGPTGSLEESRFITATKGDAEDILLEERAKELCFEGKRWYDLVRTGRVFSVMASKGIRERENLLWPININVIRQNPKIEQNSFYK